MATKKRPIRVQPDASLSRLPGVFVSYSGPLSRRIAESLKTILEEAINVEIKLFPDEDGTPLMGELFSGLAQSTFGICCMTKDNARSRWVYFEAGSLLRFVPAREMRTDWPAGITSRIVPFFYPEFPKRGDPTDNPLLAFKGKQASAKSVVELVNDIARHIKGSERYKDDAFVRDAWMAAERQLKDWEDSQAFNLRVGRFSPYHGDILDHCTEIDKQENDFRKFICDRLLRGMRDAVSELTHPRPTTMLRDFHQFKSLVTANLCKTTEILALCGSKPWGERVVDDYYDEQYRWAEKLRYGSRTKLSSSCMRRIFVRARSKSESHRTGKAKATSAQRAPEQKRVIDDHVRHARVGVAAAVLDETHIRAAVPLLNRVWTNLIKDGFGFIAMRHRDGWSVFAHMNKPGRVNRDKFLGVRFESGLVASVVIELFEDLWKRAEVVKGKR